MCLINIVLSVGDEGINNLLEETSLLNEEMRSLPAPASRESLILSATV